MLPRLIALSLALFLASFLPTAETHAQEVGSTFTYQGELRSAGVPSDGPHDFQIVLYADASGGEEIATVELVEVAVERGLFSVPLDFTRQPFEAGFQYWLELRVRASGDAGPHTTLQPRQPITASPYALNALSVRAGSVGSAEIDNQAVQQRITGRCDGVFRGSIQSINADGSVVCETEGVGSLGGISAGFGLNGGVVTSGTANVSVNTSQIQRRVSASCVPGSSIRSIAADGSVSCQTDNDSPGFTGYEIVTATAQYFGGSGGTGQNGVEARCPSDKRAIGGGVDAGCAAAQINQSWPRNLAATGGWWGAVLKRGDTSCPNNPATMIVYAICATIVF